jgi:amidohydrolase
MPEPGGGEVSSVARLAGELEEEGFVVETGLADMPTSFRATIGEEGPTIALLTEYDAIPGLGHACGHNLICAAAYGAAVALAPLVASSGGRVVVAGAPAEETFGGKVVLAERGALDDVDVALLAHPGSEDRAIVTSMASWSVDVVFEGKPAHAVAAPEEGINALDAVIQLLVARDALLKALDPSVRLPGVVLEGGRRPNVVPERARVRFSLRARDTAYLVDTVVPRFRGVVEGVARSTGTRWTMTPVDNLYDELRCNRVLADAWSRHANEIGVELCTAGHRAIGSLDMGALSHRLPALHPVFRIVETPTATHTPEFTAAAREPLALRACRKAAKLLALTTADLLTTPELVRRAREEHEAARSPRRRPADATLITELFES